MNVDERDDQDVQSLPEECKGGGEGGKVGGEEEGWERRSGREPRRRVSQVRMVVGRAAAAMETTEARAAGKEEAAQAERPAVAVGMRVTIQHLVARPELNGSAGVVTSWNEEKERWVVEMDGDGDTLMLRPPNLQAEAAAKGGGGGQGGGGGGPSEDTVLLMLESMWRVSMLDIESTLRHACNKVLSDQSVDKDARKARAKGLVLMGRVFQAYGSADALKTTDFSQHIRSRLESGWRPRSGEEAEKEAAKGIESESARPLVRTMSVSQSTNRPRPSTHNTTNPRIASFASPRTLNRDGNTQDSPNAHTSRGNRIRLITAHSSRASAGWRPSEAGRGRARLMQQVAARGDGAEGQRQRRHAESGAHRHFRTAKQRRRRRRAAGGESVRGHSRHEEDGDREGRQRRVEAP